jgi:hypothetical protein
LSVKNRVDDASKKREQDNQKEPDKFVRRFFVFLKKMEANPDAEEPEGPVDIMEIPACPGGQKAQKGKLYKKDQYNEYPSPEYKPDPYLLHIPALLSRPGAGPFSEQPHLVA